MAWQVYDAKARFSELLDAVLKDGPQSSPAAESKQPSSSQSMSGSA